jgi:rod shape-determining protein MreC
VQNNHFQRSKYLAVALEVTGNIYAVSGEVESYLNLRKDNADLLKKIAELQNTVYAYEKQLELLVDTNGTSRIEIDSLHSLIYTFMPARVVDNSVSGLDNYIMLNKGYDDGIKTDMGVISSTNSVVGIIMSVSPHFCKVIPILNSKFNLSCMVNGNDNYSGPLVWDGKDSRYSYLQKLPRHAVFETNDTVVTSGYSNVFPKGLPVGVVADFPEQTNDDYASLRIKLFTNFNTLTNVLVIRNSYQEEQKNLQKN